MKKEQKQKRRQIDNNNSRIESLSQQTINTNCLSKIELTNIPTKDPTISSVTTVVSPTANGE